MDELNTALTDFANELRRDEFGRNRVEVTVIAFGSHARVVVPPTPARDLRMPRLSASGASAMGEALELALGLVDRDGSERPDKRARRHTPVMFLLTDGSPTDSWRTAAERVSARCAERRLSFFGIGMGNADFDALRQVCPGGRRPLRIRSDGLGEAFQWMTMSMTVASGATTDEEVPFP